MTFRHGVLTVAALAVLGLGVYLFIEVKATPATANVVRPDRVASTEPAPPPRDLPTGDSASARTRARIADRITTPRKLESVPATPAPAVPPEDLQKVDALMSEANKAYDGGEFDEAKQIALRVLGQDPTNVRMLRIVVSSSCIDGDSTDAQKHYLLLPTADRKQMQTRCARYGVTFTES